MAKNSHPIGRNKDQISWIFKQISMDFQGFFMFLASKLISMETGKLLAESSFDGLPSKLYSPSQPPNN